MPLSAPTPHAAGELPRTLTAAPLLEIVGDWRAFLSVTDADGVARTLQHHERTGRPPGDQHFLTKLEALLHRVPKPKKPGRVVLSTVTHYNSFVLRIWLDGQEEPLEPTKRHRLYSEDRQDWVPAGELTAGEHLRTLHGPAEITRIESKPGVHRVYNIEVETEHCYYVSAAGVLSHNTNGCGVGTLDDLYYAATRMDRNGFTYAGRALQKHASRGGSKWQTNATRASQYNDDAAWQVMDVLTHPGARANAARHGRWDFIHPDGRGIRFNGDGSFYGFLD